MQQFCKYAISCDDENGLVLSNFREEDLWNSLQRLVEILTPESQELPPLNELMAWRTIPHRKALARDPYTWRSVIDLIKNSDLRAKCVGLPSDELVVLTDKPLMLKIAGEITSAYMHSYNLSHKISFKNQNDSKEPS